MWWRRLRCMLRCASEAKAIDLTIEVFDSTARIELCEKKFWMDGESVVRWVSVLGARIE